MGVLRRGTEAEPSKTTAERVPNRKKRTA